MVESETDSDPDNGGVGRPAAYFIDSL